MIQFTTLVPRLSQNYIQRVIFYNVASRFISTFKIFVTAISIGWQLINLQTEWVKYVQVSEKL